VILLSDGLANVGPKSPQELRQLGNELAARNITVTTIGLGEDYNEDLMAGLAESSDANYYYVKDTETLPGIFAKELGELLAVAAREVRIEIICPKGVKPIGFIGRGEKFENQKASVTLNSFTPGQNRHLFLRCLVSEPQPEIARVTVNYTDELAGGASRTTCDIVKIKFTENKAVAVKAVNKEVASQKELVVTAVVKDAAMAAADAGKYKEAAAALDRQVAALNSACVTAPAAVQAQIRCEVDNLTGFKSQLERGEYGFRKEMQSQSWTTRNSK
jgi:Ca-activated chloride channel family protein